MKGSDVLVLAKMCADLEKVPTDPSRSLYNDLKRYAETISDVEERSAFTTLLTTLGNAAEARGIFGDNWTEKEIDHI